MRVGAVEQEGDVWADVVAEGGFGGGEGWLGDEFVVLGRVLAMSCQWGEDGLGEGEEDGGDDVRARF